MKKILLFILCLCISSCTLAKINVDVLSERTTLENQILGTYNALDNEMLFVASVRGVDSNGNVRKLPKHSQEHKDAVEALQIISFHNDDLQYFKQLGWVGENNNGLLTSFSMAKDNISQELSGFAQRYNQNEFDYVVSQINQSREIVMKRVIEMNENLKDKDFPKIKKIFGKINIETSLPGEKIQYENGKWGIRK